MVGSPGSYRLTPRAKRDLEDIWSYTVSTWSAEKAEEYHGALIAVFIGLAMGKLRGCGRIFERATGSIAWGLISSFID
jgi:toxin ParE1/3/4